MGHALLFVSFAFLVLLLSQAVLLDLTHPPRNPQKILLAMQPRYVVLAMAFAYIITLISSYFFFPLLWMRSFGSGLQWDGATALRNAHKLIPTGILMAFAVGAISKFFLPMPKSIPMDEFFKNSSDAWLVTAFGILLAPMFEEICFRGFLLPAIAIAYDWLSLPRTPAARERWHITTGLSMPALLFSAIISSLFFTLLHAEQLAHAWAVLFVLFCVSLVLTAVRLRIRSVAASTLVHASYNFTLFFGMFVATGGYRHLERMTR
ncbi:MAG: CPBP family glutamic-type intramembrane protease [Acidobacteriaceae bacterium]|nr:CPBP family glutamic-type intramembrane protease [Acidobacteriaceae bacterium]